MRFIFEYKDPDEGFKENQRRRLNTIRKMMLSFENMINTVFPQVRVHLSEESTKEEIAVRNINLKCDNAVLRENED